MSRTESFGQCAGRRILERGDYRDIIDPGVTKSQFNETALLRVGQARARMTPSLIIPRRAR